jgi:DNA-binding GntR family transcriptional regulator
MEVGKASAGETPIITEAIQMRSKVLVEEIYGKLRDEIINLVIQEGTVIKEKDLADRFEVSTTPVRDALSRLIFEGYVEKYPNQGYVVKSFSLKDYQDIFQYRRLLELAAIEIVCKRATDRELEDFQDEVIRDEQAFTYSMQSADLNTEFHMKIVRLTKNPFLMHSLENAINHTRRILLHDRHSFDYEFFKVPHEEIARAIRSRNVPEAQELLQKHILDTQARILIK